MVQEKSGISDTKQGEEQKDEGGETNIDTNGDFASGPAEVDKTPKDCEEGMMIF